MENNDNDNDNDNNDIIMLHEIVCRYYNVANVLRRFNTDSSLDLLIDEAKSIGRLYVLDRPSHFQQAPQFINHFMAYYTSLNITEKQNIINSVKEDMSNYTEFPFEFREALNLQHINIWYS